MSQTPPILHGPSEKERKYDRQLRLWAASGQAALESANLLLVNSGAGTVGSETLKNLVLPGMVKVESPRRQLGLDANTLLQALGASPSTTRPKLATRT